MSKIKGWKKIRKDEEATMWENKEGGIVSVRKYYGMRAELSLFGEQNPPKWVLNGTTYGDGKYTNRAEAEKEAIDYIKDYYR